MTFEGKITPELFRRAAALHSGSSRAAAALCAIVGVGNLFIYLRPPERGPEPSLILPLGMFALSAFLALIPSITLRRAYNTYSLLQQEFSGDATRSGLTLRWAHGESTLPWSVFHRATLGPDAALLYVSAYQYNIFGREWFSKVEEWQAFCALVSDNVRLKKRPRPYMIVFIWSGVILLTFFVWSLFQVLRG